jgi:Xaa-Pro aminopeptidase
MITQSNPLFITDSTNIRYLTGFVGAAPEEREAYVLLTPKETFLFTNALYLEQAKKLKSKPTVVQISRDNPISKELAKKTTELGIQTLGFEEVNLTVAEFTKLQQVLNSVTLMPTRDTIELTRQIKRPDEIASITRACAITDSCFDYILGRLKPGVSESDIAWEIQSFCRNQNATDAFSPIVAFGANSSMPDYSPTSEVRLSPNTIILLDFGARVDGYCADMTRVVFLGKPNPEGINAYTAVLDANKNALELLSRGERSGAKLDAIAQDTLIQAGLLVYPHSLGHNVGLAIHESPRLSNKHDETLRPGMVFSIEPGVYIEGQYGIRIEDLVLLGEDGIEILSKSSKDITIL